MSTGVLINTSVKEWLRKIDETYSDPKTYAAAMSEYLRAKCKVVNAQLSDLVTAACYTDIDGVPYDPSVIITAIESDVGIDKVVHNGDVLCDGFAVLQPEPKDSTGERIEWSSRVPPDELLAMIKSHAGEALSEGTTITDWIDTYRNMVYYLGGYIKEGANRVLTAGANSYASIKDILDASGVFSTETSAILTVLDAIKNGTVNTAQDLLSEGQSLLGEITNTYIFQNIVGVLQATSGSAMDMVKSVGSMISKAGQSLQNSANDGTSTFNCHIDVGNYSDISSVSAFASAEVTVFKTAATAIKTSVAVVGAVISKLFSWGVKLVKKTVEKVIPYVTNPILTENSTYDRNTIDFPVASFEIPCDKLVAGGLNAMMCYGDDSLPVPLFTALGWILGDDDLTLTEFLQVINTYVPSDEALVVDMKFGQLYIYSSGSYSPHVWSDDVSGSVINRFVDLINSRVLPNPRGCVPTVSYSSTLLDILTQLCLQVMNQNDITACITEHGLLGLLNNRNILTAWSLQDSSTFIDWINKVAANYDAGVYPVISDSYKVLHCELYAIPTSEIVVNSLTGDDYLGVVGLDLLDSHSVDHPAATLAERLSYLFPDNPEDITITPEFISTKGGAKAFCYACRASEYRMMVYWILRCLVYQPSNTSDFDINLCDYLFRIKVTTDPNQLAIKHYDISVPNHDSGVYCTIYSWSLSLFSDNDGLDVFTSNLIRALEGDAAERIPDEIAMDSPSQFIKYACLTSGTVTVDYSSNYMVVRQVQLIWLTLLQGVIFQIVSNKYEYMKSYHDRYDDFPVFIPYKSQVAMDTSHYHLQTNQQMAEKAQKLKNLAATVATILLTVAAVVAIKFLVNRFLSGKMEILSQNAETSHYDFEDIQSSYSNHTPYTFIAAGTYTSTNKQQLHWVELYGSDAVKQGFNDLYNGVSEKFVVTDDDEVSATPSREDYNYAKKNYLKTSRRLKFQSRIMNSLGATPVSYTPYDLEGDGDDTSADSSASYASAVADDNANALSKKIDGTMIISDN